jgi:hypothetical protein
VKGDAFWVGDAQSGAAYLEGQLSATNEVMA